MENININGIDRDSGLLTPKEANELYEKLMADPNTLSVFYIPIANGKLALIQWKEYETKTKIKKSKTKKITSKETKKGK